jgi:hypothetical protein
LNPTRAKAPTCQRTGDGRSAGFRSAQDQPPIPAHALLHR